jgi:16S rRNA (uracil1498-N3)-methyltransferase
MLDRFFIEQPIEAEQTTVELSGDEAHHLGQVLRAQVGREVLVFDGTGYEWWAKIVAVSKKLVKLQLINKRHEDYVPQPLTIGVALPKGDRQKWLIEKLVELNVKRFIPLIAERGVAQPVESALERLRRQAIEACKQCGRVYLLEIANPLTLAQAIEWVKTTDEPSPKLNCLLQPINCPESAELIAEAEQQQKSLPWLSGVKDFQDSGSRYCWIGPEGGWTTREVREAVTAGCAIWDLGPRLLRVETAAICVASAALLK